MIKTRRSVSINRSPQDVFDYVTDPANTSKWQGPTESARWTSEGPPGVGSTQYSVIRFLGRKIEYNYEITLWDPPNTFGFKAIEGSTPFQSVWEFEPNDEGGTELTTEIVGEISGFFKLAQGLVRKQFEKQFEADFNALKQLLEVEQG